MSGVPAPEDLVAAGYRIEFGDTEEADLYGLYWWTWSKHGCGIDCSNDEWLTAEEAIADARKTEAGLRHADEALRSPGAAA